MPPHVVMTPGNIQNIPHPASSQPGLPQNNMYANLAPNQFNALQHSAAYNANSSYNSIEGGLSNMQNLYQYNLPQYNIAQNQYNFGQSSGSASHPYYSPKNISSSRSVPSQLPNQVPGILNKKRSGPIQHVPTFVQHSRTNSQLTSQGQITYHANVIKPHPVQSSINTSNKFAHRQVQSALDSHVKSAPETSNMLAPLNNLNMEPTAEQKINQSIVSNNIPQKDLNICENNYNKNRLPERKQYSPNNNVKTSESPALGNGKGKFNWIVIEGLKIPSLLYKDDNYLVVKMIENKILAHFPSEMPEEVQTLPPLNSMPLLPEQIELFNAINQRYGLNCSVNKEDLIVKFEDFIRFYNVIRRLFPDSITRIRENGKSQNPDKASNTGSCDIVIEKEKVKTVCNSPNEICDNSQTNNIDKSSVSSVSDFSQRCTANDFTEPTVQEKGWVQINNTLVPFLKVNTVTYVPLPIILVAAQLSLPHNCSKKLNEGECTVLNQMCSIINNNVKFDAQTTQFVLLDMVLKENKHNIKVLKYLPGNDPKKQAVFERRASSKTKRSSTQPTCEQKSLDCPRKEDSASETLTSVTVSQNVDKSTQLVPSVIKFTRKPDIDQNSSNKNAESAAREQQHVLPVLHHDLHNINKSKHLEITPSNNGEVSLDTIDQKDERPSSCSNINGNTQVAEQLSSVDEPNQGCNDSSVVSSSAITPSSSKEAPFTKSNSKDNNDAISEEPSFVQKGDASNDQNKCQNNKSFINSTKSDLDVDCHQEENQETVEPEIFALKNISRIIFSGETFLSLKRDGKSYLLLEGIWRVFFPAVSLQKVLDSVYIACGSEHVGECTDIEENSFKLMYSITQKLFCNKLVEVCALEPNINVLKGMMEFANTGRKVNHSRKRKINNTADISDKNLKHPRINEVLRL